MPYKSIRIHINKDPLQYAGGYSLDLYCDTVNNAHHHGFQEFPHQFMGENFADCAREARRQGWVIHQKTRTATCPKCSGKKVGETA